MISIPMLEQSLTFLVHLALVHEVLYKPVKKAVHERTALRSSEEL